MKNIFFGSIAALCAVGLYFAVDRFLINPDVTVEALDVATKSVKFEVVPEFELLDINGKNLALKEFSNQLVIINFWATWCAPCVEELPSLLKFAKHFEGKVEILALANDASAAEVKTFLRRFGGDGVQNFRVALDASGGIAKTYGTRALPESYILAPGLKFVRKIAGFRDWMSPASLKEIESLLKDSDF